MPHEERADEMQTNRRTFHPYRNIIAYLYLCLHGIPQYLNQKFAETFVVSATITAQGGKNDGAQTVRQRRQNTNHR